MYASGEQPEVGDVVRCVNACDTLNEYGDAGNQFTVTTISEHFINCTGLPSGGWRTSRFELVSRKGDIPEATKTQDAINFAERQRAAIAKALEDLEAAHMSHKAARVAAESVESLLDEVAARMDKIAGEAMAAYDRLERARAGDLD